MLESLCVFCGSRPGTHSAILDAATELGSALAARNVSLVYGGGHVGIMGVLADAVLAAGGKVTGVIPDSLVKREVAHPGVEDMRVVVSMHTRKAMMSELADGYAALPGGLGTFEELFEVLTWKQLGFHGKPIAALNVNGYFDPLIQMLDRAVDDGFMKPECRDFLHIANTVPELLEYFKIA